MARELRGPAARFLLLAPLLSLLSTDAAADPLRARIVYLPEGFVAFGLSPDGSTVLGADAGVGGGAVWRRGRVVPLERDPELRVPGSFAHTSTARARVALEVGFAPDAVVWRRGRRHVLEPLALARDVSADGRVIVGLREDPVLLQDAVRWVRGAPTPIEGQPGFRALWAESVSADGHSIFGYGLFDAAPITGPYSRFLWRDGVATPIEGLGGNFLELIPYGIGSMELSADGTTVSHADPTGEIQECEEGGRACATYTVFEAWRWRDGEVETLGFAGPGQFVGIPFGISRNGEVIVGVSGGRTRATNRAFLWDRANGMRELQALLESLGADTGGHQLSVAYAVSDDGRHVVGDATPTDPTQPLRSFLATLPPACADRVDNDGDGRVDFPQDLGCRSPRDSREGDPRRRKLRPRRGRR